MAEARTADARLPFPVLLGDIGGTNARFALVEAPGGPVQLFPTAATGATADIETAVEAALGAAGAARPRSALIDVAAPVTGDEIDLTNADWLIRPRDMIRRLGLSDVVLLNDFEALALALTALGTHDVTQIGGGAARPEGAKVVVGPGTGLGVGALISAAGRWVPVPGEGGHVSIGPVEPDEFALWPAIEPELGRISAEALLAGRGLVRLYRAVAHSDGVAALQDTPAGVTNAALAGDDPVAVRTLEIYARLLGRIAGDMALIFMATGGVYLGGGIPPRILPFLASGELRRAFDAKAPHDHVLGGIPISVITRANPALPGLAAFASHPERFGVSLAGRHWRR